MGSFYAGLDLGQVGDPSALAVVEFIEPPRPFTGRRPPLEKHLLGVYRLPLDLSYQAQFRVVAERLAPLGPEVQLVYDRSGSRALGDIAAEAFREGLFSRFPRAVTIIGGEGTGSSTSSGDFTISKVELVRNLREMIATEQIKYSPTAHGVEELIREAMAFRPQLTTKQKWLTFNATGGEHDDRLIATAFAVYPRNVWNGAGSRVQYRDPKGRLWEEFAEAQSDLGQMAYAP